MAAVVRFRLLRPLAVGTALALALAVPASGPARAADPPRPALAPAGPNAVVAWNDHAAAAARAACVAPFDNPLHESRMYAVMHVAVHDALNAVSRRSQPYAYRGRAPGASPEAAVAAAARTSLLGALDDITGPFVPCHDAAVTVVDDCLRRGARGHPRQRRQAGRHRGRQAVGVHDPGEAGGRRLGHPAGRDRLPAGRPARRVPVRHRRPAVRLRARLGRGRPPSSAGPTGSGSSRRTGCGRGPTRTT